MKKLFIAVSAIALTLSISSCKNRENKDITKWLTDIYCGNTIDSLFVDEWVYTHCSDNMQQTLQAEYDYDCDQAPCWGSWIIGGWGAGEDLNTTLEGITFDGTYYYATLLPDDVTGSITGKRIIRFVVNMVDNVPVIDECEWIEDFTRTDSETIE